MLNSRLTVGFLTINTDSSYQIPIWHGIEDEIKKHDINFVSYVGGAMDGSPRNHAHELAQNEKLDALIVMSAVLGDGATDEHLAEFLRAYQPIPIIHIGIEIPNVHNVLIDGTAGLAAVISHLIEEHNRQRIAFIRGPEGHDEADQRYQVYLDVLEKYNIPFDPDLVAPGNFVFKSGHAAVTSFIDERDVAFDAIAAANDNMAIGALRELQRRNIKIPQQVAIVGFDDTDDAQSTIPPLSTVRQPLYKQGQQAARAALDLLNGKTVPPNIFLPAETVIRQSCGCLSHTIQQAVVTLPETSTEVRAETDLSSVLETCTEQLIDEVTTAVDPSRSQETTNQITQLIDSFNADLVNGTFETFQPTLDKILQNVIQQNGNVHVWQNGISTIRRILLPLLAKTENLVHAENLWSQGRVAIGEVTDRTQLASRYQSGFLTYVLNEMGTELITALDIDEMSDLLTRYLPQLGIPSCYLSLFENAAVSTKQARLILAYDENGRSELPPEGLLFQANQLVPSGILPEDKALSFMLQPLFYQDTLLGFVLFDTSKRLEGMLYETLRVQLSSAFMSSLAKQEEKLAKQLRAVAEVGATTATILDQDELLQRVVDLTQESFDYYHVHIYMLNETGDILDLASGSGEVGRQMIREEWHIPLEQKNSLIARAARTGEPVIVEDVYQVKDWLPNPLLPATRSELALPIFRESNVIGVMDVQSDQMGNLDESDADLLRTLSSHITIALTNIDLFQQTVQAKDAAEQARAIAEKVQQEAEIAREEAETSRQEAEAAKQAMEVRVWQTKGQAELNNTMRGEQDMHTLANSVIKQICQYLNAHIGALYVALGQELHLTGSYAYSNKTGTREFKFGEGLIGQTAVEKQPILLTNIPADYITVKSGLGETPPRNIMVFPILYDDNVKGVIELGTLNQFTQQEMEFLSVALDNIGITMNTAQARDRINELLSQTQRQAEELQAQGEELRVANEELEAQTESLRTSEAKLREKQIELESTNTQLEEKAAELEENSIALRQKQAALDIQNKELKTAQIELETKAEELALASKYKSEFLANMSHELRTPLNSLLILARMLMENKHGNLNGEEVESAQIIYNGGNDLLDLINDILDLSKVESGKMQFSFEPMSLQDLGNIVRTQFGHVADERGLSLNIALADDLPDSIETDSQRITQIVKNLLSNAFKFTMEGSVSLDIYRPDTDVNLSRSGLDPANTVAISVTDTGIGMTTEQKKIIFEAFQQADGSTSRQYGGTGLGLSISRELASKLGGEIEVESESGEGSTFTLYLPIVRFEAESGETAVSPARSRSKPKPTPKQPPTKPASPPPNNDATQVKATSSKMASMPVDDRDNLQDGDKVMLLIEDDPKFAKIVYNYSQEKGFKSLIAGSGKSGLELASIYNPDAIILDLNLPDMTGWEILEAIKNDPNARHIPVHIMSVEDEDLDAYRKGAMGYITKPVSKEDLEESFTKISEFVDREIKSLLLVEDDDMSRRSIRMLLDNDNVQISEAAMGKTAVDLLETQHFDCMILDLSLPDMTGFQVLEIMNKKGIAEKCPIIVYTGRDLTPEENMQLMQYADSVIVKGVKSPERLLDETALFLHQVVADMPEEKQKTIKQLYNQDDLLKGKKILIVDDDMRNSFALSKLLSDKEIEVRIAQNGQKALDLIEQEPFDLVLMDIMMPVMDGYETTKQIRRQEKYNGLPILALTAKAMKGDREKCIAAGANDYLPKPIDVDRLFSMLRVWLYQ